MQRSIIKIVKKNSILNNEFIKAKPSKLFQMVWPITQDAWAFKGDQIDKQRLQRNVTNLVRRKR